MIHYTCLSSEVKFKDLIQNNIFTYSMGLTLSTVLFSKLFKDGIEKRNEIISYQQNYNAK